MSNTLAYYADKVDMYPVGLAQQIRAFQCDLETFTLRGTLPPPRTDNIQTKRAHKVIVHAQFNDELENLLNEVDELLDRPSYEREIW